MAVVGGAARWEARPAGRKIFFVGPGKWELLLAFPAGSIGGRPSGRFVAAELHAVVQGITSGLSLDDALARVLRAVERLVGASSASIYLVEADGIFARRRFTTGGSGEPHWDDHVRIRPNGITETVLQNGEPIAIEDTRVDLRTRDIARPDRLAVAVLPMHYDNRDIGILFANWGERHLFQADDLDCLATLATYGAIAIENARLHAQERESRRDAEEAHQRLQRFLAMVAHDLEGPLTMVVAYGELLRSSTGEDAQEVAGRVIPGIERAARRIQRLVNDLLFVSQLGSNRLSVLPTTMDLVGALRTVAAQQQSLSSAHRITLDAPAVAEGEWDQDKIANVFTNLVTNAVKFSPDGGDVRIMVEDLADSVTVRVSDQGVGIASDLIPRLFQPFSRLDHEHTTRGAGLGLYIAKAIVELHGGRIWVKSEAGRGSVFTVVLPRWRPTSDDLPD